MPCRSTCECRLGESTATLNPSGIGVKSYNQWVIYLIMPPKMKIIHCISIVNAVHFVHVSMSREKFIFNLNFSILSSYCWSSAIVDITLHHACQHIHRIFYIESELYITSNFVMHIIVNVSMSTEFFIFNLNASILSNFFKCTEIFIVWSNWYMFALNMVVVQQNIPR